MIPAYNEELALPQLLGQLLDQTYPLSQVELILIDSASTDSTRQIMNDFMARYKNRFGHIAVLENPRKIIPAALNIGLEYYHGDALVRIDAHARIAPDFLQQGMAVLAEGHDVVGGTRPTINEIDDAWHHTLHAVEESLFGSSIALYRRAPQPRAVSSIFHGFYRRAVYEQVGPYNEELLRTEDNDMSYRIRQAGYTIWFDPRIKSWQLIRPSLSRMTKQKYANGYWIGWTLFVQPGCVSIYHMVPLGFVLLLTMSLIVGIWCWWMLVCLLGAYFLVACAMSVMGARSSGKTSWYALTMPGIFFLLHCAYGVGTIRGMVEGACAHIGKRKR